METVRAPSVAGTFYPENPEELRDTVAGLIALSKTSGPCPKAVITPHAGYIYSGPIAASAYALIEQNRRIIRRVILIGPSHYVPFRGLALSSAEAFETPLGKIPQDLKTVRMISKLPHVNFINQAHEREHSLEVQLPFLQMVLEDFVIVPITIYDASPSQIREVLEHLWGEDETLIVISSDLSHYLDYERARQIDQKTAKAIENIAPDAILDTQACGAYPIRGFLHSARDHGLRSRLLDLRNSGDTTGDKSRVVGYGSFSFEPAEDDRFDMAA